MTIICNNDNDRDTTIYDTDIICDIELRKGHHHSNIVDGEAPSPALQCSLKPEIFKVKQQR